MGRADTLTQLDQQLQKGDRVAISTLTGMGGIGKSELALQYAWKEWPKQTYRGGICWLNIAESDPGLSILSFAQIHLGLTLPDEGELSDRVRFCWQHWLKNEQDQALIIFDDVRHYQQIKAYLPSQAEKRFKVIITTRNENLSATIQTLHLELLDEEPALALLRSYVTDGRIDQQLGQAKLLCRDLGYLPLALELVARLLKRRKNWTIQSIRERLAEKGLADQSLQKNPNFDAEMTAQNGVKAAFDLSWEVLDSNAQQLAMYLSLFSLAPFSKSLIDSLLSEQDPEEIEEYLIDSLVNLNLVSDLGGSWYELHTLIWVYLREKLEESEIKNEAKKAYCKAIVDIAEMIPEKPTFKDIDFFEKLIEHLKNVVNNLNEWVENKNLIGLFSSLIHFYQDQGLYDVAVPYCEKCLALTQQRLGKKHPCVAESLNNLASLYSSQGKYQKAEELLLQSLNIWRQLLGNKQLYHEHIYVAQSFNSLGMLYRCQGRYEEAEVLLQEALDFCEQICGKNNLYAASVLNNLSVLYTSQGKHEKAKNYAQQALEIRQKLLGGDHFYVASSLNTLGSIYRSQGRYEEAKSLLKQSLKIYKRLLGNEHLDVAFALDNLANLYYFQQQYNKAKTLLLRSLSIREKQLGENHPDVANSLNNLAGLYQSQGKYAEAEPLYQRAIAILLEKLGENHPNTQTVAMNYYRMLAQLPDDELNQRFPPEMVAMIQSLR